jgi:predicted amidohydrolase YtcJ
MISSKEGWWMKRLVVLLLGLLLAALLCLGATETLVNRSGKAATGVVIQFSEPVRITSYDQVTFPNQEPTGRAERFSLSGGSLPNGGRVRVAWSPTAAEIQEVAWAEQTAAASAAPPDLPPPTLILHNGIVIPMETEGEYEQALALAGDMILTVGSDAEILALATPDTEVVDLQGRTVLPGILDPHTHLFNDAAGLGMTLDDAQQLALENGVTSVANLHTNESETEQFVAYAAAGNMRIRLSLYLIYNDSCGTVHGTWYAQYSPLGELAPRLRVGGVKIFAERSVCGEESPQPVISPELVSLVPRLHERGWDEWQLMLSPTELRDVVARAQEKGYQVAIHAMGDLGIATSLNAIEAALNGSPNTYRHMVLHNWILTDELLGRYAELGIGALMDPSSKCERTYRYKNGPEFMRLLSRIRDLVQTGAHVALDSDWPNWGQSTISPFVRLRCAVTDTYVPEMIAALEPPCPDIELPTDQTITVWQGLRMMTAEAAYAMRCDDRLGTLRPGKLADLIVVTADPMRTDPESLDKIAVMMTMVDGKIEFESPDYLALRSAASVQEGTDAGAGETPLATTVFYGGTVVSMTSPSDLYEAIAIQGNRILALGTNEEILALASPDTQRIDLQGRTALPGFIDPHTHLMVHAPSQGLTWDGVQQLAFRNGVTAAAEMFCDQQLIGRLVDYASSGALRLRLFPFLIYNDSCDTVWGTWYEQYSPVGELAPRLRVGGVKMFAERSICGDRGTEPVFSPALQATFPQAPSVDYRGNQLVLSRERLATAIRRAQEKGYPVAIHAIGDAGVEASLLGIADALAGKPNTLRHMILHDRFIRDDLLGLYAQYGILAVIEPTTPCWWAAWIPLVGVDNGRYFGRWKDLVATGAHVACDSDALFYGEQGFAPIQRLAALMRVGDFGALEMFEPCAPFPSNQALSAWQGLRMMTAEAAYALHLEEELGTLEPGKLADVIVLSANPLAVEPAAVGSIQTLLTMLDGVVEWQHDEFPAQNDAAPAEEAPRENALEQPVFVIDDLKDGDFTNALSDFWQTLTQEECDAGGAWQRALLGQDAAASMRARHVSAAIVSRQGKNWIDWSFSASGWVALRTWTWHDARTAKGVYMVLDSTRALDLTIGIDYRQVGAGSWEDWDVRSASSVVHLDGGEEETVVVPFDEFIVDDTAWAVPGGNTLGDVDRTWLESIALIAMGDGTPATVYLREIGFYGVGR